MTYRPSALLRRARDSRGILLLEQEKNTLIEELADRIEALELERPEREAAALEWAARAFGEGSDVRQTLEDLAMSVRAAGGVPK